MKKLKKVFVSIGVFIMGLITKVYAKGLENAEYLKQIDMTQYEVPFIEKVINFIQVLSPIIAIIIALIIMFNKKISKKVKIIIAISIIILLPILANLITFIYFIYFKH